MAPDRSRIDHLPPEIREALATDLTVDITTRGRKSGQPRRIEIWFLKVDDTIYITGTPGPRDWLANLAADPTLVFHLKESIEADLPARAFAVNDRSERRRVLEAMVASWYRDQSPIEHLIDRAPMVRLEFDPWPGVSTNG